MGKKARRPRSRADNIAGMDYLKRFGFYEADTADTMVALEDVCFGDRLQKNIKTIIKNSILCNYLQYMDHKPMLQSMNLGFEKLYGPTSCGGAESYALFLSKLIMSDLIRFKMATRQFLKTTVVFPAEYVQPVYTQEQKLKLNSIYAKCSSTGYTVATLSNEQYQILTNQIVHGANEREVIKQNFIQILEQQKEIEITILSYLTKTIEHPLTGRFSGNSDFNRNNLEELLRLEENAGLELVGDGDNQQQQQQQQPEEDEAEAAPEGEDRGDANQWVNYHNANNDPEQLEGLVAGIGNLQAQPMNAANSGSVKSLLNLLRDLTEEQRCCKSAILTYGGKMFYFLILFSSITSPTFAEIEKKLSATYKENHLNNSFNISAINSAIKSHSNNYKSILSIRNNPTRYNAATGTVTIKETGEKFTKKQFAELSIALEDGISEKVDALLEMLRDESVVAAFIAGYEAQLKTKRVSLDGYVQNRIAPEEEGRYTSRANRDQFKVPTVSTQLKNNLKRLLSRALEEMEKDEILEIAQSHQIIVSEIITILILNNFHPRATSLLGYLVKEITGVNTGSIFKIESKLVLSTSLTKNSQRSPLAPEQYIFVDDEGFLKLLILLNLFHEAVIDACLVKGIVVATASFGGCLFRLGGISSKFGSSLLNKSISHVVSKYFDTTISYSIFRKMLTSFQSSLQTFTNFINSTRHQNTIQNHHFRTMHSSYIQVSNLPIGFSSANFGFYKDNHEVWLETLRQSLDAAPLEAGLNTSGEEDIDDGDSDNGAALENVQEVAAIDENNNGVDGEPIGEQQVAIEEQNSESDSDQSIDGPLFEAVATQVPPPAANEVQVHGSAWEDPIEISSGSENESELGDLEPFPVKKRRIQDVNLPTPPNTSFAESP